MNRLIPLLLGVLAGSTGLGISAASGTLRDCIDTHQINEWHIVDSRHAIVRTGPKHYLVTLQSACPQLSHPPGLIFRGSPSNASVDPGRICGEVGETVRSRQPASCAIKSVDRIDKARFEQLEAPAKRDRADH